MTHSQMISLLIQTAGSSVTVQRAIELINRVQNEMVSRVPGLTKVSPDPFLATVSGTYAYAASSSLHSSIGGIQGALVGDVMLTGKELYSYDFSTIGYNGTGYNRPSRLDATGKTTIPVDIAPSKRALAQDCQIVIYPDYTPATTTTSIRVVAYLWPTQVTTASTTLYLSIPDQFQHKGLLWGCLRDLNISQYQDLGNPAILFENEITEAKRWSSRFVDSAPSRTPIRW